jgi:adenylylsulfate reductase subunit A
MAERLNGTAVRLEKLGLAILKEENGDYAARGERNIKINGENIKPILAAAVEGTSRISVLNRVNVFRYITRGRRICGAYALSVDEPVLYVLSAKAVICATGGASGLYKPNNPGFSRHKMWYPPFNTGAGYAMGIEAGAEMTSFEMRFIALRCKDTIAPTGTLAQGVGARQINALGDVYEDRYGIGTAQRLHGTVTENIEGRGPCYLKTVGITREQDEELQRAYLNMAPSQTLKWLESGETARVRNVEIEGTEPYIVGGHTASGYWVDARRETTVKGLFAAGDAAGGCPQKYVTGAFAEGELAAEAAAEYAGGGRIPVSGDGTNALREQISGYFTNVSKYTADLLEEKMQSVMDQYAGGIGSYYRYNTESLTKAGGKIRALQEKADRLRAENMRDLLYIFELRERLTVCRVLIAHLKARKETRWHSFAENTDYPEKDASYERYVNSRMKNGRISVFGRKLVSEGQRYEHRD